MAKINGNSGDNTLNGTNSRDTIRGGAGNDVLFGNGGNDLVYGEDGNDTIDGGTGNDTLDGGSGDDRLLGGDGKDKLIGGDGKDYLDGGDADDSLSGGAGDDTLFGGAGRDRIYGGDANDTIDGGADGDTIYGEAGNDEIEGGLGDDKIWGGDGEDSISGGDGKDSVDGGQGADVIRSGAGDDSIAGGNDYDTIRGDDGNDTIQGDSGGDTVYGGAGNDVIAGGQDNDLLHGEAGNDAISGDQGNDTIHGGDGRDVLSGGIDNDVIYGDALGAPASFPARAGTTGTLTAQNFAALWGGIDVTARNVNSNGTLTSATAANVGIHADGIGASGTYANAPWLTAETGYNPAAGASEQLIVSFNHDVSDASAALSWFFANEGEQGRWTVLDDGVVVGTSLFTNAAGGGDFLLSINPGSAFDTIVFEAAPYANQGATIDDSSDYLVRYVDYNWDAGQNGGDWNDTISGGDHQDTIHGAWGDDTIYGGAGNDTLDGGPGDDVIYGDGDAPAQSSGSGSGGGSACGSGSGSGDNAANVTATAVGHDYLTGGQGNDTLWGDNGGGGGGAVTRTATGGAANWVAAGITLSALDLTGQPGTVSYEGNGVGVLGSAPVTGQINHNVNGQSEKLVVDFGGQNVSTATVVVSNLIPDENGGERGKWVAYDAGGGVLGSGTFGPSIIDSHPGVGDFTISGIGAIARIEFTALSYADGSGSGGGWGSGSGHGHGSGSGSGQNDAGDSSDYYIRSITYTAATEGAGGNDTLDGGAGNDRMYAEAGHDMVLYTMSENVGAHDDADGGSGYDTLRLTLSAAEYASAVAQADIAAFQAFLAANSDQSSQTGQGAVFHFAAFDLDVRNFEGLQLDVLPPPNSAPTANADALTATEDTPAVWAPSALLGNDTDPDAGDSIHIASVGGAVGGTVALDGSGNVVFTPAANYSGTASFTYAIADSHGLTSSATVTVNVGAVADAPSVTASSPGGNEDTAIALNIAASLTDASETLSDVTISGVPAGASLSAGTDNGDGSWTLSPAQLSGLTITPPHDGDADFTLTISATSTQTSSGDTATTTASILVEVAAVADAPALSAGGSVVFNDDFDGENGGGGTLNHFDFANWDVSAGSVDLIGNGYFDAFPGNGLYVDMSGTTNQYGGLTTNVTFAPGTYVIHLDLAGSIYAGVPGGVNISFGGYSENIVLDGLETASIDRTITLTAPAQLAITDLGLSGNGNIGATLLGVSITGGGAIGDEDTAIPLDIASSLTDTDGSETLSVTLSGVPAGAVLSAGTDNGDGTWTLTSSQLAGLTITPPHDSDADFSLTVTAISTEGENGDTAATTATLNVVVNAVADAPSLTVSDATGNENSAIPLSIASVLSDTDGSETLSVTISGVPAGAVLSAGTDNGDGTWTLTAAQLAGLTITPPANSGADFTLTVTATSSEGANGDTATTTATIGVTVNDATADAPTLAASNVTGDEDTAVALDIVSALTDTDGSETLSVTISGMPSGAVLSAGTDNGDGTWTLTPAQLAGLTVTPPADSDEDFTLAVSATSTETGNGDTATTTTAPLLVTVNAVADAPVVAVAGASGGEDSAIPLSIGATLGDTDGSETITSVTISGVPTGAVLSAGTDNGDGTWTLTPGQLAGLTVTPPPNSDADFTLTVSATSSEAANGDTATTTASLLVTVNAVADAPAVTVSAASGNEDTAIPLSIGATLGDADGSESIASIVISGVPSGAVLSAGTDNGDGTWTLTPGDLAGLTITPPANSDQDLTLTVSVTSTEGDNGDTATTTASINVTVNAVADDPAVTADDVNGHEGSPIPLAITATPTDTDGSETVSITISGVPTGAELSAGTDNGGGTWTLTPAQFAGLTITPPPGSDEDFDLAVSVTSTESDNGDTATTTTSIAVSVTAVADAPVVTVSAASGDEDGAIPLGIGAALGDTDGSESIVSIVISGVPAGAALSAGTDNGDGTWTLTPSQLAGLTITPPADSAQDFVLAASVTSAETANGSTATTTASITVAVNAVADEPTVTVDDVAGEQDTAIPLDVAASLNDTDGSETLSIAISGVPSGATLSAGMDNGDGTWTLTPSQLAGLTITPPVGSSDDIDLVVTATATEGENGDQSVTTASLTVTVEDALANAPTLTVGASPAGDEDTAIALAIDADLVDLDGSETLSITISGVPTGAVLSAGTDNGDGSWTLTPSQLAGLTITPPADSGDDFTLAVSATATETENGDTATTTAAIVVTVHAVADAPAVTVDGDASGSEDDAIPLDIASSLTDTDGSETLSVTVSGVPAGAVLSAGADNGDGTWSLTPSQLAGLTVTPAPDSDADFTLTVAATATEGENGDTITTTASIDVTVDAVTDAPTLSSPGASGDEDTAIALNIGASLTDGSETLSPVSVFGLPDGALLSAGTFVAETPASNPVGGAQFQLNSHTASEQSAASVTALSDGGFVAIWQSLGQDGNGYGVFAQRFDADGNAVSRDGSTPGADEIQVNATISGNQLGPVVTSALEGGGWVSAWLGDDSDGGGVFAQRFNADGTTAGGEFQVNTFETGVQSQASITALAGGGFVVTWTSADQDGSGAGVFGQQYDANGVAMGGEFQVNTTPWSIQDASAVASLADGGYVVTWEANNVWPDMSGFGVFGQRYDASGAPVGGEFIVNTTTADSQSKPDVVGLPDGGFITVWQSQDGDGWGVYAQRFDASGAPVGGEIQVNSTNSNDQTQPHVTVLAGGGFAIAWQSQHQDGSGWGVYAREFGADGAPASSELAVNTVTAGNQINVDVAALAGGGFAVTWDSTDGGGNTDVFGRVFEHANPIVPAHWDVDAGDLAGLTVTPPADSDEDFTLSISVTSTEPSTGETATATASVMVAVNAVADAPALTADADIEGSEDSAIPLDIASSLTDADASETLSVTISGVPAGAALSAGTDNGDGSWTLTPAQLGGLAITPPAGSDADFTLTVAATSTEAENGDQATTTATIAVAVDAVTDAPTLGAPPASGNEDTAIGLDITAHLADLDGSETLSQVRIDGVPDGAMLSAGTFVPASHLSGIQAGDEFGVNTHTASEQSYSSITALSDGGFVVVWQSLSQDGSGYGIYAQRFDAEGNAVSRDGATPGADEIQVNTTTSGNQLGPVVTSALAGGGWVSAWLGDDSDGSGIFAQRFNADGTPAGGEFQMNSFETGSQSQASITALAGGGFVATWTSADQDGSGAGVFGQQYDANGAPVGGEFQVNTTPWSIQDVPSVTALSDGGYVVVWEANNVWPDISGFGVFGQRYDASGAPVGGEFIVNTTTAGSQAMPDVVGLADGGFVAVWQSQDGDGWGVYAQRFDASGAPVGAETLVAETTTGSQDSAAVSALPDGGFVVTWQSAGQDGDGNGVYARSFAADGLPMGGEFQVNQHTASDQGNADVAVLADGSFAATWDSTDQDGSSSGVFGRVYSFDTQSEPAHWIVDAEDLPGLAITPPADSDADFTLTLTVTSTEISTGQTATTTASLAVTVHADADAPTLHVADATGNPNAPIALDISGALTDTDLSENLSFVIAGMPPGAALSAGTDNGDGTWTLTEVQLSGLAITPPPNSQEDFALTVSAVSTEGENGDQAVTTGTLNVTVSDAVAEAPTLAVSSAAGDEDNAIALDLAAAAAAGHEGDTVTVTLSGMPVGASLSAGTDNGDGSWTVSAAQLTGLTITPPADSDADFTLTVTARATEPLVGNYAETTASLTVEVEAVADAPSFGDTGFEGGEDTEIGLDLSLVLGDTDGSESLSQVRIVGLPEGAVLSAGTFVPASTASDPVGGAEFRLNDYTNSDQSLSSLSALADGGFIAVWQSLGQDGNGYGVFAQRFDADGDAVSRDGASSGADEFGVNTTTSGNQIGQTVAASLTDGGWVVTWVSDDGDSNGIFGQRFDASGNAVSWDGATLGADEAAINTTTAGNQSDAIVSGLASGGFIVAWNADDGSGRGVFAQQYSATGQPVGAEFQVNSNHWSTQELNAVTALSDGGYVVTWHSFNAEGTGASFGIFGQRYDASGATVGGEFQINTHSVDNQQWSDVVGMPDGGFVVVWQSMEQDGSGWGVYAQRFDASGAMTGGEFRVNGETSNDQTTPSVAAFADGGFVVAWQSLGQDGSDHGVYAQTFNAAGQPTSDELLVNVLATNNQVNPDVTVLADGRFVVTWDTSDGSSTDIAGRVFEFSTGNAEAYWLVDAADLGDLTVTPPADSDADFDLTVTAVSTESSNGDTASTTATVHVAVNAVADEPSLLVGGGVSGNEGDEVPLDISASLTESVDDGSEGLSIVISGVPAGAVLSAGSDNGDGSWTLSQDDLDGLTIASPDAGGTFTLTVTAMATEQENGNQASQSETIDITLTPVADSPIVTADTVTGYEDTAIPLDLSVELGDLDGSETLSVTISGVPAGAALSAGTDNGDGTWTLTSAQLAGLAITPPANDPADFTLTVSATAMETETGETAETTAAFTVDVVPVNDAPVAADDTYTGVKNTPLVIDALGGVLGNDSDPADSPADNLSAEIVAGAGHGTVALNADGSFTYTPNSGYFGADQFTYRVVDGGGTANGGQDTSNVATVTLFVDLPVGETNAPPVALDSSLFGVQDEPISGQVGATDADHSWEDLSFEIVTGPQHGTLTFNPDGTFTYTPAGGFSGFDDFTFKVTDPFGDSDVGVAHLDVAQVTPPPEFQPADTGAPTKTPVIASLADGSFVMAWSTTDLDNVGPAFGDGAQDGVYFQHFTAGGTPIGGIVQANTTTFGSQNVPSITALADGGFLLVWTSSIQDGDGFGIYAQRFDANGLMVGRDGLTPGADEMQLNTRTTGDQDYPVVAGLPNGGWVAAWTSFFGPGLDNEIVQQVFDANGNPVGGETVVNIYNSSSQYYPDVTVLADGGWVVVYQSFFQDTGQPDYGIYAHRYDANGNPAGADGITPGSVDIRIHDTLAGSQDNPAIAALQDGGFAVVWDSDGNTSQDGSGAGIFLKVFDASGNATTGEILVNTYTDSYQTLPDITTLDDGSLFVTWTSEGQDGAGRGVYGQRFLADGTKAGEEFQINTFIPNNQTASAVMGLEDGSFVAAWQTQIGEGNNIEQIAARLFGASVEGMRDLSGGVGNDVITGAPGNDSIDTGGGNDIINGRDGNDVIVGGAGADQMTGGSGADTFVWHSEADGTFFSQLDAVTDFNAAEGDGLDFSAFVTLNGGDVADFVQLTQEGDHTKVSVDVDGALNGQNFTHVVLLQNVTGLEVHDMQQENNLVVTL